MGHRHAISDADVDRIKDLLPGRPGQTGWVARDTQTPYHAALLLLEQCTADELRDLVMQDLRTIQGRVHAAERMTRASGVAAPLEPAAAPARV